MTTKHRFRKAYRIELRERDHWPPHVHVTGKGADVRISLETLVTVGDAPAAVLAEALALMKEWQRWHP